MQNPGFNGFRDLADVTRVAVATSH